MAKGASGEGEGTPDEEIVDAEIVEEHPAAGLRMYACGQPGCTYQANDPMKVKMHQMAKHQIDPATGAASGSEPGQPRRKAGRREPRAHDAPAGVRARARGGEPEPVEPGVLPKQPREPSRLTKGSSWDKRFEKILKNLGVDDGVREFVFGYWLDTPGIQNPYALFDFLSKVNGIGGAQYAKFIVGYVFGGQQEWGPPGWAAGGAGGPDTSFGGFGIPNFGASVPVGPGAGPGPKSREFTMSDMVHEMAQQMQDLMVIRSLGSAFNSGNGQPPMRWVPLKNADGTVVQTSDGKPVYVAEPLEQAGAPFAEMMKAFQKGESVDPSKMMGMLMDAFKTGLGVNAPSRDSGSQMLELQKEIAKAQLTGMQAQLDAQHQVIEAERASMLREIEASKPDKLLKQYKELKDAGLFGGDNLESLKLQMAMERYKIERQDVKEQQAAEAQVRIAEAQEQQSRYEHLVGLAQQAFKELLAPVTGSIAEGIRARVAGGGPPPGATPPPAGQPTLPPQSAVNPVYIPPPNVSVPPGFQGTGVTTAPVAPAGFPQPPVPPPAQPTPPSNGPPNYAALSLEQKAAERAKIEAAKRIVAEHEEALRQAGG